MSMSVGGHSQAGPNRSPPGIDEICATFILSRVKGKGQQKGEANKNKKTEANKKAAQRSPRRRIRSPQPGTSRRARRSPRPTRSQSLSSRPRKPRRARRRHRNPRRSRTPRPVLTRIRRRRPSRPTPRRRPRSSPRMSMMVQTRRRIRLRWIEQPSGNELSPKPTTTREIGR